MPAQPKKGLLRPQGLLERNCEPMGVGGGGYKEKKATAGYSLVSYGRGRVETSRKRCHPAEAGLIPRQSLCAEQWEEKVTHSGLDTCPLAHRLCPRHGEGSGKQVLTQHKNCTPVLPTGLENPPDHQALALPKQSFPSTCYEPGLGLGVGAIAIPSRRTITAPTQEALTHRQLHPLQTQSC